MFYKPIQPTVNQPVDNVTYSEFIPEHGLQNFIYCYWQLKTTQTLSDHFNYRVVADGCIDIFFELNSPQNSFVMGFSKKFTELPLSKSFNYIGVRFLPTMFPQLFKVNASELSNRFEQLSLVVPETSNFIKDNFSLQSNIEKIKVTFDNYFLQFLSKVHFVDDSRLYKAIELILKNCGVIDIEKDINTGISPRQLRRLFE